MNDIYYYEIIGLGLQEDTAKVQNTIFCNKKHAKGRWPFCVCLVDWLGLVFVYLFVSGWNFHLIPLLLFLTFLKVDKLQYDMILSNHQRGNMITKCFMQFVTYICFKCNCHEFVSSVMAVNLLLRLFNHHVFHFLEWSNMQCWKSTYILQTPAKFLLEIFPIFSEKKSYVNTQDNEMSYAICYLCSLQSSWICELCNGCQFVVEIFFSLVIKHTMQKINLSCRRRRRISSWDCSHFFINSYDNIRELNNQ